MATQICPQCESENLTNIEGHVCCADCGWFSERNDSFWANHGMHIESYPEMPLNDFYHGQKANH